MRGSARLAARWLRTSASLLMLQSHGRQRSQLLPMWALHRTYQLHRQIP